MSAHVFFFNSFFFRQLLFFGSMFFKLAVTLQKDAPGDTDHGERLSGQKYWKLQKLGRIYCWGSQKTWNSTFHFLASSHSISDLTFEPFDIFQQIDCPRTCLCGTQLSWKFERNRRKKIFVDREKMKRVPVPRFIFWPSTQKKFSPISLKFSGKLRLT